MTTLPLVTLGMTCFNGELTIGRAVQSALAQTWLEREILIVDDGSTDGSLAILSDLARLHPEVRVVRHQTNRGFPSALNTLLAEARGELIAFLDDDDESAPNRISAQHERLTQYELLHPGAAVFCYSNRRVVSAGSAEEGERLGIGRVPPEPVGTIVAEFVFGLIKDDGRHCWGMFGSGTLLTRTETLRAAGGFDHRFRRCAELDLVVRAALGGAHFVSVDAPLMTQYLTVKAEKAGRSDLRYRLMLLRKHQPYLKERKAYVGTWCNVHAQYYSGRRWWWRLWYIAALICFPWPVARSRLRKSSVLGQLHALLLRSNRGRPRALGRGRSRP